MEHMASVPASTRPLFLGLAGKRFEARVENVYRRKTASCECLCLSSPLSLSLSLFFSISSSVGWFNRETRNEKSAGTKSAKLRPILVVDSILLLFLRKCVDIPTVMSYVKLSPTFSVPLVSPTYLHTCFEGCEYVGEGEGGGTQASIARA